jgi:hypothetical protein
VFTLKLIEVSALGFDVPNIVKNYPLLREVVCHPPKRVQHDWVTMSKREMTSYDTNSEPISEGLG